MGIFSITFPPTILYFSNWKMTSVVHSSQLNLPRLDQFHLNASSLRFSTLGELRNSTPRMSAQVSLRGDWAIGHEYHHDLEQAKSGLPFLSCPSPSPAGATSMPSRPHLQ